MKNSNRISNFGKVLLMILIASLIIMPFSVYAADDQTDQITDEIIEHVHEWDEGQVVLPATCETEGEMLYTCLICGETKTESIAPLGHLWGEWVIVKEATTESKGLKKRVCERDPSHVEEEEIPQILTPGWNLVDGVWYYLNDSGELQTGWLKWNGKWYYMDQEGAMQTGWLKSGSSWYWLKGSGAMASFEWAKIGSSWYWFAESGKMATGWKLIDGEYYYLGSSGAMQKSKWVGSYYLLSNGTMATNQWVDGGRYYVGDDGKWIKGYGNVYWSSGGKVYHSTEHCVSLARSDKIMSGTVSQAQAVGKSRACHNCC